jgi:hypothetical protein
MVSRIGVLKPSLLAKYLESTFMGRAVDVCSRQELRLNHSPTSAQQPLKAQQTDKNQ